MVHEGVLGKDYVTLKGRGGRDLQNGATVEGDTLMHLSVDAGQTVVCGLTVESFVVTYADVDIDCAFCIAKIVSGEATK